MSMTPPPGWYPDPSAPATERWWDGSAWTEHRRALGAPPPAPATPSPAVPAPATPPPAGFGPVVLVHDQGGGRRKTLALAVAALVVVAAAGAGIALLGGGDDDTAGGGTTPSPSATRTTGTTSGSPSPSPEGPAADDPSVAVDDLDGITLPVLDGWKKPQMSADHTIMLITPDTYDCPGEGSFCHHGSVASSAVTDSDTNDPKVAARRDISKAADHVFDENAAKERPYDGIVSHKKIKEGAVAVAGRAGYMVRWRVKTGAGPGGYVESLVFPSTIGSGSLVCVRFAFDAGDDGPPLSDMDRITKGIRPVGDAATGGGAGSSVGPSR